VEVLFNYAMHYAANLYAYNCVTNFVGIKIELDVGDDLAVVAARWAEASVRNIPLLEVSHVCPTLERPASFSKTTPSRGTAFRYHQP
jgi:hypothetical protein